MIVGAWKSCGTDACKRREASGLRQINIAMERLVGFASEDESEAAIIRTFAAWFFHRRRSGAVVTRKGTKGFYVPWNHPVLVEERAKHGGSIEAMFLAGIAVLYPEQAEAMGRMEVLAALTDHEVKANNDDFALTMKDRMDAARKKVDDALHALPENEAIRRWHAEFYEVYDRVMDAEEEGA